jgi:hypothetical protein
MSISIVSKNVYLVSEFVPNRNQKLSIKVLISLIKTDKVIREISQ